MIRATNVQHWHSHSGAATHANNVIRTQLHLQYSFLIHLLFDSTIKYKKIKYICFEVSQVDT